MNFAGTADPAENERIAKSDVRGPKIKLVARDHQEFAQLVSSTQRGSQKAASGF